MSGKLIFRQAIPLPPHPEGDYDHGDVHLASGRVFIANTAAGNVEVLDGEGLQHLATIPGCPEASGVLCAQEEGLVFAAARGTGKLLVIDAASLSVVREIAVGFRPNGLAWDPRGKRVLVADVQDNQARLVDPQTGAIVAAVALPGRPRWCVYQAATHAFLVNIREPAEVVMLSADVPTIVRAFPISAAGPHGLDLDQQGRRAFVACDGERLVTLDLTAGRQEATVPISGVPDAIWHNQQRDRLYVAMAKPGLVEVVNTATMVVEEQIKTEAGAHTTAYDAARQRLYVFLPSCQVAVYEESEVG
jgi:DNA-binding beta-propeller fold protein YncE